MQTMLCGHHRNNRYRMVLLSFLSKQFVSTKWRIYKGILASPRILRQEISRRLQGVRIVFFNKVCQKILYEDLKWKKDLKREKNHSSVFLNNYFYCHIHTEFEFIKLTAECVHITLVRLLHASQLELNKNLVPACCFSVRFIALY